MRRARSLLNLPVLCLADGRVLGRVRDVVFDPHGGRIAGLLLREAAWLSDARVVPLERIRSLGRDAITVPERGAVVPALRARPVWRLLNSGVTLTGLHVITESGRHLGTIDEVFVGSGGEVLGYELDPGVVEETLRGKRLIPGTHLLAAGPDAAIVPDLVAELVARPEQAVEAILGAPAADPAPAGGEPAAPPSGLQPAA